MTLEQEFGFKFYKLKDEKEQYDTLIYDVKNDNFGQYSKSKAIEILRIEIRNKKKDVKKYIQQKTNVYPEKPSDVTKILKEWIGEEIQLIDNVNYKTVDETIFEEDGKLYFNIYKMSNLLKEFKKKYNKNKIKKKEFKHITKVISHLVNYDKDAYDYYLMWLAHIVRFPLDRLPTSMIFLGTQGTGKGIFYKYVLKPIFENNTRTITMSDLDKSSSNEYMFAQQLIQAEEIMHNENKSKLAELQKTTTNDIVSIQRMYKVSINVNNYSNWIYCSNKSNPVHLEDWDRRYNVFKQLKPLDNETAEMFCKNVNKELPYFLKYLYDLEINTELLRKPIDNEERKDLIAINKDSIKLFLDELTEDGVFTFDSLVTFNPDLTDNVTIKDNKVYIAKDYFYTAYIKWIEDEKQKIFFHKNKFGKQLKFYGWEDKAVKHNDNNTKRSFILPEGMEYKVNESNKNYSNKDYENITENVETSKQDEKGEVK